eukprot:5673523-Prymnesium_polylepis.2
MASAPRAGGEPRRGACCASVRDNGRRPRQPKGAAGANRNAPATGRAGRGAWPRRTIPSGLSFFRV